MAKTRKKKHQRNSKNKKDKRDHDQTDNKEMKRAGQMDSLVRSRFPDEPTHELFTAWQAFCGCHQAIRPLSLGRFPSYLWII